MYMIFQEGKKVLRKIWMLNISIKKRGKLLVHSAHPVSGIYTIKKSWEKLHIFTARCKRCTICWEIDKDKEVVDEFLHVEEVENKHLETLKKLVEDKKSILNLSAKQG